MGSITLVSDGSTDVTILSNIFIDDYMKDANDAQLKIYLYLLRMLQAHEDISISDIADKFNHTEKDVMRALCYWEKCHVLALEYTADKKLASIRLVSLSDQPAQQENQTPQPQSPAGTLTVMSHQTISSPYEKPLYTADQLKAFGEQESTAQLFFVAEQYLGRTLTPGDMKSILFFSDKLHFSDDLIDYLLQYCVERGKRDFRYIEKVAIGWAESGITTPAEAEKQASRYDKTVYSVMNALGKTSSPARNEIAYIQRWTKDFGFELDIILEACARTVLATDKHRFAYADRILEAWFKAGVHHVSDITGLDASHQREKASKPARTGSTTEYNRFMHSTYDFEALEKELLKG